MAEINAQISTSIEALTREFELITHNLANVSTAGFKRRCNAFARALESASSDPESYSPGEVDLESAFDFSQGNLTETGRSLDLALFGKGFFVIETPEGPRYTRNGVFSANQNGQIVDSNGRTVAGDAGPITIPAGVALSQIYVSSDGTLSSGDVAIGTLRIVDFQDNESTLVPAGDSCFVMPDADVQPTPAENVVVKQGYQESSNVKIIDELVDMIMVTRLYEANMKVVSAARQASDSLMSVAAG